jgi:hypothetical protein
MGKRLVIRVLGGLAALMLINGIIRLAFDPSWYYGNDALRVKMDDYGSQSGLYNTAMIGSSCIFWNLDPVLFDSLQPAAWGIHSFNFGSGGTIPPETYHILDNLLARYDHSLRQIIVELRDDIHFPAHHVNTLRKRYFMNPRWYAYVVRSGTGSPVPREERHTVFRRYGLALLERLCNIDYFNSIYGPADELDNLNRKREGSFRNRSVQGFLPVLYNREIEVREAFLKDTSQLAFVASQVRSFKGPGGSVYVNKFHVDHIQGVINKCNSKGIHVVFLIHPKLDPVYVQRTVALARYIPENHLIDLSDPDAFPELYLVKNSLNNNHFNIRGTEILSNLAARKFTEIHHSWLRTQTAIGNNQ